MANYDEVFQYSLTNSEDFWAEAAKNITWYQQYDKVLDSSNPPFYKWFPGGKMNTCYNAVDRHVENGRGDQVALIYDSPVTGTIKKYTYKELLDKVSTFAGVLAGQGVGKGDTVIIYMPMIPEAAIAMLACARLGAIHSVVFGGFAPHELAIRIDHALCNLNQSSCFRAVRHYVFSSPYARSGDRRRDHCPGTFNLDRNTCIDMKVIW